MSRLKEQYQNEIVDALTKKFGYKNIMEVPKLDKVVINMGVGEAKDNAKLLDSAIADLEKITGQKAVVCRARKSVANFKLREGMAMLKIKKGDTVKVIAGKDKDKEGKVIAVDHKNGRVTVEGVNMLTKHTKPSMTNQNGGIVHQEGSIDISNVMYLHKGKATRVGIKMDGDKKVRFAKSTGEVID